MILSWTHLASIFTDKLKKKIKKLTIPPKLVVILVGENPSSIRYIQQKEKAAKKVGIDFELIHIPSQTTQQDLISLIKKINLDTHVSWCIVQLPLPNHINTLQILWYISDLKDVDWFHPINQGKLLIWDKSGYTPCTPKGIMELLNYHNILLQGKKVVILGRSNIVWKPLAALCINAGSTVISCNSHTKNIHTYTRDADIVISAIWKPHFISADDVSSQAILIDVGFTVQDNTIYGDIDYESCKKQWNTITPVPWGVWPLTVAMLLENTYFAHLKLLWKKEI